MCALLWNVRVVRTMYKLYAVRYRLQNPNAKRVGPAQTLLMRTTQDYNPAYWQADTLIANMVDNRRYVSYKLLDVTLIEGNVSYAPDGTRYRLQAVELPTEETH